MSTRSVFLLALCALASLVGAAGAQPMRTQPNVSAAIRGTGGLTTPVVLTIATPSSQGASMTYLGPEQVVTNGGYVQFPSNPLGGASSAVELSFAGAANKSYVVDCTVSGVQTVSMGVQIGGGTNTSSITPANAHAAVLVPAQSAAGQRRVFIAGQGAPWRFMGCSITPNQ